MVHFLILYFRLSRLRSQDRSNSLEGNSNFFVLFIGFKVCMTTTYGYPPMLQITQDQQSDLFILGIGASAGGMEAIHLLFDNTPEDGVAYVIIQHLSKDYKSFMAELLAKHSKLKILIVEDGMYVEPNQVYLMPAGKNMTIHKRRLRLVDSQEKQPNTAIDIFLDSLAEDQGDKSIAVILSGTGTDGTKGVSAIKRRGGYVIVQDPSSSKFDGMPNSAIDSGDFDIILPPELIPEAIITFLRRVILTQHFTNQKTDIDELPIVKILELIKSNTLLDFSEYKRPTLLRRIVNQMSKHNLITLEDYVNFLKANPAKIEILANEFLNREKRFFKDEEAFEVVKKKVLKELAEKKLHADSLRVWVVGCGTGEEAYSLAIVVSEYLSEIKKDLEVKIFASDVDKEALLHAAKGVYSVGIEKDVSEIRLKNFFVKKDNTYRVREGIRKMIIFAEHDIIKQPPYGKIDLISCRNFLMYFNPVLKKKVLASFHLCLNNLGFLFIGLNETLGDEPHAFIEMDKQWKIFKRIEIIREGRDTTLNTLGMDTRLINLNLSPTPNKTVITGNTTDRINQALLEVSGYDAGLVVDINFEIIQTFGDYEKYLLPKLFNFKLLEILPDELSVATALTLNKAIQEKDIAKMQSVRFKKNEVVRSVDVFARPFLSERTTDQNSILVLFSEGSYGNPSDQSPEIFKMDEHSAQLLEETKKELAETKQKLWEVYQELNLSNEHLASNHEELISANQELQSINEEHYTLNEELQSLNHLYEEQIKELAMLNDDLNNFLKSTVNSRLFVDRNLIIRKFTPSSIQQVNLIGSDVGRPVSDISTNIKFSTLMEDITEVIATSAMIKKEIQTLDGNWYYMIAIPYIKEKDNQNDGVLITFNDITELKKAQDKLSRINADHSTFIYSASHDLKAPLSNIITVVTHLNELIPSEGEEEREMIELMLKSIQNLKNIIQELSDISKIELEINEPESVNLTDLIEDVEVSIKDMLDSSDTKLILDLKVPEIPFARKNLRSILLNLLTNAIKYKSPDRTPEVTIRTDHSDNFIVMTVEDNGLGIPEDKRKKIFGAFQRVHTHVEGSGVGLYLVKKTITNAGGDIVVESEMGKGSTFHVYFRNEKKLIHAIS